MIHPTEATVLYKVSPKAVRRCSTTPSKMWGELFKRINQLPFTEASMKYPSEAGEHSPTDPIHLHMIDFYEYNEDLEAELIEKRAPADLVDSGKKPSFVFKKDEPILCRMKFYRHFQADVDSVKICLQQIKSSSSSKDSLPPQKMYAELQLCPESSNQNLKNHQQHEHQNHLTVDQSSLTATNSIGNNDILADQLFGRIVAVEQDQISVEIFLPATMAEGFWNMQIITCISPPAAENSSNGEKSAAGSSRIRSKCETASVIHDILVIQ